MDLDLKYLKSDSLDNPNNKRGYEYVKLVN